MFNPSPDRSNDGTFRAGQLHRKAVCLILLVTFLVLAHAGSAGADVLNCQREVDTRAPVFARALSIADGYWLNRGYGPEPGLQLCMVPDEGSAVAQAGLGGETIWLDEYNVTWLKEAGVYSKRDLHPGIRHAALDNICQNLTHERGHNFGLTDEDPNWPVMNPDASEPLGTLHIKACSAWAWHPWLPRWRPIFYPPEARFKEP